MASFQLDPAVRLVPVAVAQAIVGRDYDDVCALVDQGWLLHVFDLAAGGGKVRELRIWRGSLLRYVRREKDDASLEGVLADLFPLERPRLRSTELAKGWSVTRVHIKKLLDCGLLDGETRDHTTFVTRKSAAGFLRSRSLAEVGQAAAFDPATLKSSCNGLAEPLASRNGARVSREGSGNRSSINDSARPAATVAKTTPKEVSHA
jgi:hypothetical protein